MAASLIGNVDQVAAANLARELELELDDDRMRDLVRYLADHRRSTLDLALTRARDRFSDAVQRMLQTSHSGRSADWFAGCRSAEAEILMVTASLLNEAKLPAQRSKGQILRAMIQNAKKKAANNPEYRVIEVDTQNPVGVHKA